MNDMLRYAMEKAVRLFGDKGDNIFTSACLSEAITKLAGVNGVIDGHIIRCLMVGRPDVEILDDCHFRLKDARHFHHLTGGSASITLREQ